MFDFFYSLISNRTFGMIGACLGAFATIVFIIMFALKRNRDERGWKIFGKASFISFIWLIFIINFIAKLTGARGYTIEISYFQYANTLQWVYTSTIIIEIIAVLILKKKE